MPNTQVVPTLIAELQEGRQRTTRPLFSENFGDGAECIPERTRTEIRVATLNNPVVVPRQHDSKPHHHLWTGPG